MKKTFIFFSLIIVNALIVMLVASSAFATDRIEVIESDGSWKATTRLTDEWVVCPGTIGEQGPEWTAVDFDDSDWGDSTAPWEWPGCERYVEYMTRMWIGEIPNGPNEVFFRKSFTLNALPISAEAIVYVDDNFQMYVNGIHVANKHYQPPIHEIDITPYLQVGGNVLAFRAWDGCPYDNCCDIYDHLCEGLEVLVTIELPEEEHEKKGHSIAYDPHNNRHLLVYHAEGDIYGQLINCDGTALGPEVLLTETTDPPSDQRYPSVAYDSENQVFLVAWEIHVDSLSVIWGRTVDVDGTPVGSYGFLISFDAHLRGNPSVACDSVNNMFLVVWNDGRNWDDTYYDIYGQIVSPQGICYGDNIVISEATNNQTHPSVSFGSNSNSSISEKFLVTWNDYRDVNTTGYDIYGQLLHAGGTPLNQEFVICNDDKDQVSPSAAYNSINKRFLVVWSDGRGGDTTMLDIYGQMVTYEGSLDDWDQIVISEAEKFQYGASVAYNNANNSFLVVWSDERNKGPTGYMELGNIDIYGQVVNGNGILSSGNFVISDAPDAQTSPSLAYNSNCASFLVAFNTLETGVPQIGFALPGDLNGDCCVDYDDYLIFRTAYRSCQGDANFIAAADLDGDGCVTINDYRIFRTLI